MTQSNEPDKYIRDMNPFVPFAFHVSFKVDSEDALDTLRRLHQFFDDRRLNAINPRREFFQVSQEEVERALNKISRESRFSVNIQQFEFIPLENEYLRTLASRNRRNQTS